MKVKIQLPKDIQVRHDLLKSLEGKTVTINRREGFIEIHNIWNTENLNLPPEVETSDIIPEYPTLPLERLKDLIFRKISKL